MERKENSIMEDDNKDSKRLIPIPELFKDVFIVMAAICIIFFFTLGLLGQWRRRIVREDRMTSEFKKLRERGEDLKKE